MSGRKKRQAKLKKSAVPLKTSGGYLFFAAIGAIAGAFLSISINLSVTTAIVLMLSSVIGILLLNRLLLYFGLWPNSGATVPPAPKEGDYLAGTGRDCQSSDYDDDCE